MDRSPLYGHQVIRRHALTRVFRYSELVGKSFAGFFGWTGWEPRVVTWAILGPGRVVEYQNGIGQRGGAPSRLLDVYTEPNPSSVRATEVDDRRVEADAAIHLRLRGCRRSESYHGAGQPDRQRQG